MLCITSIFRSIDIAVICLSFALKWRSITISIDRCRYDTTKCVSYSLKYILQYLVFNQNAMRPEICVHSWTSHLGEFLNANRLIRLHFLNKSVSIEIFVTAPVVLLFLYNVYIDFCALLLYNIHTGFAYLQYKDFNILNAIAMRTHQIGACYVTQNTFRLQMTFGRIAKCCQQSNYYFKSHL